MPAFDRRLTDDELINLIDYLEGRFGRSQQEASLAAPDTRRQQLSDKLTDWRDE